MRIKSKLPPGITYWLGIVIIGLSLGLAIQFVRAWTEPTTNPPGGNLGAPINTGDLAQGKTGGLIVNGTGATSPWGLLVPYGSVGIGTASPGYKLHVFGGYVSVTEAEPGTGTLRLGGLNNNPGIWSDTNGKNFLIGSNQQVRISAGGNYNDTTKNLIVDTTGSVGIGTASPSGKLTIGATTNAELLSMYGGGLDGSPLQRFGIYADTNYGLLFEAPKDSAGNKLNYTFSWRGGGNGLFIQGSNGSVGIGTASPQEKLEVAGNLMVSYPGEPGTYNLDIQPFVIADAKVGYKFITKSFIGGAQNPLTFDNNGNVGIGTNNPATKLEVQGGPIKATDGLIIETRTSDPPPQNGRIWLRTDL